MADEPELMACGCSANTYQVLSDGTRVPFCIIHDCGQVIVKPDLYGRRARCTYYGTSLYDKKKVGSIYGDSTAAELKAAGKCISEADSNYNLPFFQYTPDSIQDRYYCGCWGWD